MDHVQRYFLTLLSCSLTGGVPPAPEAFSPADWEVLFRLAREQKLLPLIFEALCRSPQGKSLPRFPELKREVISQVMLQARKTAELHRVLDALTAAGLQPLVVKGAVCRGLYPQGDHRPSSDEDVLIPPEQSAECHRILTGLGFFTETDPASGDYEIPYRQKNGPLYIELHRSLFSPKSDAYGGLNRFFAGAHERAVTVTAGSRAIPTLEHTDHLFYLICHAFKHFLHSGFGLRQVCDAVLFAKAYESRINWPQLLDSCRAIRADRFAAALFRIGETHLSLSPVPGIFRDIPADPEPMLKDLLAGGIYGSATPSRRHSSNITLDAAAGTGTGGKAGALLASLFPPAKKLENRHPWLKGKPWLLPAAWISRAAGYLKESSSDNSAAEALKIGRERVELLKYYHILP